MQLKCFRDDGTMAIPFRIEKPDKNKKHRTCYRVTFMADYAVDLFDCNSYSEVIDLIQKTYNCRNLNFDTVELC
jgi:hypothetical protein